MTGCVCGWPLSPCFPELLTEGRCGKQENDAKLHEDSVLGALEQEASELERRAKTLRDAAGLIRAEMEN